MRRAPKARNMIARGKRRAQRGASPLVRQISMKRALKVRHMIDSYSALSELHAHYVCGPGATRLALLSACPWLSYFRAVGAPHSELQLFAKPWRMVLPQKSEFAVGGGQYRNAVASGNSQKNKYPRLLVLNV